MYIFSLICGFALIHINNIYTDAFPPRYDVNAPLNINISQVERLFFSSHTDRIVDMLLEHEYTYGAHLQQQMLRGCTYIWLPFVSPDPLCHSV